jgi:predicted membrane protein
MRRLLITFVLLIGCLYCTVNAQRQIGVAVELLNLDTIDLNAGIANIDVLAYFRRSDGTPWFNDVLRLGNTNRQAKITTQSNAYRIQATVVFAPQTASYPVDLQTIPLVIESELYDVNEQVFYAMENVSSVSPQIRLRGWDFTPNSWNTTVRDFHYPAERRTFSQYIFMFNISRPTQLAVKSFLPPSFIMVSALISFSIPVTNVIGRLGILNSNLVAQVYFHNGMNVPFTGSVMIADSFMFICYAIIILGIIENIVIVFLLNSKKYKYAVPFIEARQRILVWLICPTLYFFLFMEAYYAVIILVSPTALYVAIGYIVFNVKARRAKKRSAEAEKTKQAKDDNDKSFEEPRKSIDMDYISTQDMRDLVINKELENMSTRRKSMDFSDQYSTDNSTDELPAQK